VGLLQKEGNSMSDLRKAAEMALDALNEVTGWQWGGPMRVMDEVEDAIQALRQALAQPEPEPVAWHEPGAYGNVTTHKDWALANGWEPLYKEKT
jgi:hypothetical protein